MKRTCDAVYENGLLRPLEPLGLSEHDRVTITFSTVADDEWLDCDVISWAEREGDASIDLLDVRRRLSKMGGCLSEVVIAERGEY